MFEDTGTVGAMCRDHAIAGGLMMRGADAMILSPH